MRLPWKEKMNHLLKDKVCIVTGGARGIGKEIALLYASEGAKVVVNDVRLGSADSWIEEGGLANQIQPCYFDITDGESVRKQLLEIKKRYGKIDVLVNNAAIEFNELIGMISKEHMEAMFRVNVYGTIVMLQAVSRIMARNESGGRIINIASMVGVRGNAGQLVYSATKGAVIALTKSAAKELAKKKIRVNAIAPGLTKTAMMEQADIEKLQGRISNICMGRLAEPKDIAGACLFLASDHASYISGQVLAVDGCTIM